MKKEVKILLLVSMLSLSNYAAYSQDEEVVEDPELKALLDNESTPSTETVEPIVEEFNTTVPSNEELKETDPSISSETVDLDPLEPVKEETQAPDSVSEKSDELTLNDNNDNSDETKSSEEKEDDGEFVPAQSANNKNGTVDELESMKSDMGVKETTTGQEDSTTVPSKVAEKPSEPTVFDVGREEQELLSLAQNIQGQITDPEWNEVATAAKIDTYTVVQNDWLFKISKRIFGSGYYYPKIWSLNSFITNPHFIEPGMVLSFTTGSSSQAPEVKLGEFTKDELAATPGTLGDSNPNNLSNFGEDANPTWLEEKQNLENQGIYFQYASEETMEDLKIAGEQALNREYENYEPPKTDFDIVLPKNYDKDGFDKNSKIAYSFKEGFYLSTFVSTNIVLDFGSITDGANENIIFSNADRAYVQFDETMNVLPGDKFSIYSAHGKVSHPNSDREGYKYSIVAHIKLIKKIQNKWEVEFFEVTGIPQRGDRITAFTPKIEQITKTYNSRIIEAALLSGYNQNQAIVGYGDVIYLDRGRADGVEMGNVFETYGFKDRSTNKNITDQPTYKLGELTVITLTDNFATALVTHSVKDFAIGDIAVTKTKEAYLRERSARNAKANGNGSVSGKDLEELDVELNLEDMNDDLLKQADKIQLTEDELAELERQEREKSVIKDSEKDLKAIERLENEIEQAESILNDAKLDEDKLLEQENLNDIEKKNQNVDQESLDEIEENLGKRYLDEDLNSKDNPYGLNEYDVEEVDELLNTEKKE